MKRLTIDITDTEHAKIKAKASLSGKSLKSYVLSKFEDDLK